MSETPRPLWELVEQWKREEAMSPCLRPIGPERSFELAAVVRAWDKAIDSVIRTGTPWQDWIRKQVLGVPPKEPAQKDRDR